VRPDDHAEGFDLCAAGAFSERQALVMARGFAARGFADLSEGCTHYAMRVMAQSAQ
jgi:hypothetical protein